MSGGGSGYQNLISRRGLGEGVSGVLLRTRLGQLEERLQRLTPRPEARYYVWWADADRPGWTSCPATGESLPTPEFDARYPGAYRITFDLTHPAGDLWDHPDWREDADAAPLPAE